MSDLPLGWTTVTVGEACALAYGSSAKSSSHGRVPVLRMGNIQAGQLDWSDLVYTSDHEEIERYSLRKGDVLFNRTNSPELVGKTALYRGEQPAIYAGYLIRVRCTEGLAPEFLTHRLNSPEGRAYCWSVKTDGVSQSNINAKKLAAFTVPLPPLAEQRRIVAKLEAILERTQRAREELVRLPKLLEHHRQAVLKATIEEAPADHRRLAAVCRSITDGDHQAPPKAETGIPFITISAINDRTIRLDKVTRYVPESYFDSLSDARRPREGDVLFSVTGSIGIPAIVQGGQKFVFQRHVAILRPNQEQISTRYLFYALCSDNVRAQGLAVATGTAQLTIPLGGLRDFEIPVPSLAEQDRIVRRIEAAFAWLDKVAAEHALALALLPKLEAAILAKAFRGELVPQDPNDEPASVLLERIRAERAAAAPTKRKREKSAAAPKPAKTDRQAKAHKSEAKFDGKQKRLAGM